MKWKPIKFSIFDDLRKSGQAHLLPSSHWPEWGTKSTYFTRMAIYCPTSTQHIASTETTAKIIGQLITERHDIKDYPQVYNHNFYLIVESTSGKIYQSGPIPTISPTHHTTSPSTWLDNCEPPP